MDDQASSQAVVSNHARTPSRDFGGYFENWLRECRVMANHAFSEGKKVPLRTMKILELLERGHRDGRNAEVSSADSDADEAIRSTMERLTYVHNELSMLVLPAVPKTIVLMADEAEKPMLLRFLGSVPLVRKMMATALLCLGGLVCTSLSTHVNSDSIRKTVFNSDGVELLFVFIFLLSAAGLGASFAGLFRVNKYIARGTYDPKYETSYWISFLMGLISGLILTQILTLDYIMNPEQQSNSTQEAMKVTLALLGGFSADLVFNILNRMVETVSSFVHPEKRADKEAFDQETDSKSLLKMIQLRADLTNELNRLRLSLPKTGQEAQSEIDKVFDRCLKKIADDPPL
jgi:hypothetical protein